MRSRWQRSIVLCVSLAMVGCGRSATPSTSVDAGDVTTAMRQACPMLTDEVIAGFLQAIAGLRDNGLTEDDALQEWVDACEGIPPDGNFQGDVQACKVCMPTLVESVYASA